MSNASRIIKITDITDKKARKNVIGDQKSTPLPERENRQITYITDITDKNIIRVEHKNARVYSDDHRGADGETYARARSVANRGYMFRAPVIGDLGDQNTPLPLENDPQNLITGTGDQKGLSVINIGDQGPNSSHNQQKAQHFDTWAAAWTFGEAHFTGHRVGFHYEEAGDRYTVTLEAARPPSPLPDLPEEHRRTFPSYAEAYAYGGAFVGRYRFSTWRDRITERYAVTDPGWVEERIAQLPEVNS